MTYRLYDKDSGKLLGTVSDEQLETLIDLLEEEDETDHDYYVDKDGLDYLADQGADPGLLDLLRPHVTEAQGVEVEWREETAEAGAAAPEDKKEGEKKDKTEPEEPEKK